jgi:hypothetical protein
MADTARETVEPEPFVVNIDCEKKRNSAAWTRCMCQQHCAAVQIMEGKRQENKLVPTPGSRTTSDYTKYKRRYIKSFMNKVKGVPPPPQDVKDEFIHPCAACEYEKIKPANPTTGGAEAPFNAGHTHEAAWGGNLADMAGFKMMNKRVNQSISFQTYDPKEVNKDQPIQAMTTCNCPDGPAPADPSGCSA